jgi:hypothetical protein
MTASPPFTEAENSSSGKDNMEVRRELHTRYATPRKLYRELEDLLGADAVFNVEVRMQSPYFTMAHLLTFGR